MPEVDVPREKSQGLSDWISERIKAEEGRSLGEDPDKLARHRYEIYGEELSVDLNTEFDIYRADLTEGHLKNLAIATGIVLKQLYAPEDAMVDTGNSVRQDAYINNPGILK